jgi:SMI1 / KNR4 family (SUKH-1)
LECDKGIKIQKIAPKVATPNDLADLESKLGVKLPQVFHEFCFRWNGGFPMKDNQFYHVPATFKEFHDEFPRESGVAIDKLFGATEEFPGCDLLKDYKMVKENLDFGIIPIAKNLFGNRAVLLSNIANGTVFWWDHELWDTPEEGSSPARPELLPRLMPIALNLETFYNSLTADPD